MIEKILLALYIPLAIFLSASVYMGLFKKKPADTLYRVFCNILVDDKVVSAPAQGLVTLMSILLLLFIGWYMMLIAVVINSIIIVTLHFIYKLRKR